MVADQDDMDIEKTTYKHFKAPLPKTNPSTTHKTKEYDEQIAQKLGRGIEPKKIREEFPREVA